MFGRILALVSALSLASVPTTATAKPVASQAGGGSYGDRNRGGPYGFYSYPRHLHIDGGGLDHIPPPVSSAGTSPYYDGYHGSAYYGRDYGAPYFGGGYYDQGTYYR